MLEVAEGFEQRERKQNWCFNSDFDGFLASTKKVGGFSSLGYAQGLACKWKAESKTRETMWMTSSDNVIT